ncbi:MAG: translocation/assembly module TamB domain-containing protein [Candidatus Marinimicrobia bacterium]|nr:translocation/assembly module TamB domain-containing protein [Candidatus Neomarinimicrobiota bacterium]MBL7009959.1 translocation/assembly module TamB domain-containing protein [Candidatus Neomarinimicrobiota bacterium]MBL7029742.1 translocation/assembly module TamB domain-containing protein [Candidatus Neomarinimicrobiota bacterium]
MTKRRTIYFILALVIVFAGYLLFKPSMWQDRLESYLNNQLNENGWNIEISKFSGHLFSTLYSDNVSLKHKNGASIFLPSISTKIKIAPLLFSRVEIEELSVSNVAIQPYFKPGDDSASINSIEFSPEKIPLSIQNIYVDGHVFIPINDSTRSVHFLIDGQVNEGQDAMEINLREFEFFCAVPRIDIAMKNIRGQLSSHGVEVEVKNAIMNGFHVDGKFSFDRGETSEMEAQLNLSEYEIPSQIFSKLPLQPNLSKISATFNFKSDFTHFIGDLFVRNELGLDMGGHFNLTKYPDYFRLESMELAGKDGSLNMQGVVEKKGRFNGTIQLRTLDLSQWMINQPKTNLSGYVLAEGEILESQITALDINAEINESLLFNRESSSFSGGISYKDYKLSITNPITMTIGPSIVSIHGEANFETKNMDLNLLLTDASTFLINNFWTDSLSSGLATGSMALRGPFDTLGIDANLKITNFRYKNVSLSSFEFLGNLDNVNKFRDGSIKLKFGKGSWNDYGFENGTGEFQIIQDQIEISSFELKNGQDFLQFNGSIRNDSILFLDRFQIAYEGHFMGNPRPLTITLLDDRFSFDPFEIHVDDGIIEGFVKTNPFQGRLKFSNVSAELIKLANWDFGYDFSGTVFGEVSLGQDLNPDDFSLDITLKNGELASQSFDEFYISSLYREGILHLEELTLTEGDKTGLQVMGTFPIFADSTQPIPVDFQSSFKNIDMKILTQFAPKWEHLLFGNLTGNYNMGGTTQNTRFDLNGKVENAFYGKIPLGTVRGTGQYSNKKLEFSQFSSTWNKNHITGSAILPIDYDMASPNLNDWDPGGELYVTTEGSLHSVVFLSEYLAEIDSIVGDINMTLDIEGPPENLIRNGHITIENGYIYTVLMDEPIRHISANANLIYNQLSIQTFSAVLYDTQTKIDSSRNLTISGGLDFTKFFEPRFNIHALGNDVFFRSLTGDIEGYGDLDVTVVGKDTLEINGTIAAKNGAVYMEFMGTESVESAEAKGRTMTNYNIRFPIEDTFSIRNSQIDATISGELAISKQFGGDWDYSGEIEFIEGEIYFYVGDVFENLQGVMTLDGQGFNPFLELTASTKIGDAEIILGVFGPFDNPEWRFDSNKGYTESDILQLLTFNTRVVEDGFTSEGLGTQAQTILGAYLERQLERNFIQATGLKSAGLIEGVEISGDLLNPDAGEEFSISARVNKNFSFSYRRSFSLVGAYKKKVGVEYKLNPNFSVIGNVDEAGNIHMKFRVRRTY